MRKPDVRSLIVFPDDTGKALVDAIAAATNSLRVKMFAFSDAALLRAVVAARRRGVKVQVLLDGGHHYGEENRRAAQRLSRAGVEVAEGSPAFSATHEKSLVIDEGLAFVHTLNWSTKNLTSTRDYAVVTSNVREVREIAAAFDADWNRQAFLPRRGSALIWSPGSRDRIAEFIDRARHKLLIQNERVLDLTLVERLVRAAHRGVKVRLMTPSPRALRPEKLLDGAATLRILAAAGVRVRKLQEPDLHAKVLLADGDAAIVGSTNLTPGSLDRRRELAIEVRDRAVVDRLAAITRRDWKRSRDLDLSDEALGADLQAAARQRRSATRQGGGTQVRRAA